VAAVPGRGGGASRRGIINTMALDLTEMILDRAHNAAVLLDERGVVTYWNPSAERIFGVQREQAIGRTAAELIIPERFRDAHRAGLRRFLAEGVGPVLDRRIELAALRADGSEFPVEMTISALEDGERWCFAAFVQDISERREAEQEHERLVEELRVALLGSERRFDAIVGSLVDPVTIRDRGHRFVYANRAALEHLGFESWEQLRDTDPAAIMSDYVVLGEDGLELSMQDIPSVRILAGEPAEPLLIQTLERETGVKRWNLLKSAPVLDAQGDVEATITIIEDVTERKRAELRSAFLAEASATLASSLDYEQTLRNVAELAVPGIADWCAVDLLDEDGDRRTVAVAHVDPGRLSLAEALRAYVPDRLDPEDGLGRVMYTGEALLYPEIPDELLVGAAVDERHLELLRAVGFRSVLIVAMRIAERVLGAITLVSAESARVLDRFDVELAEQIGARAAVAIENSRLYSERSVIARTLQRSLLPEQLPEIPGYQLASIYLPAVETSMVGGDFYDVWELSDSWMVLIGDVTGKGIEAAALTSLVRHTVRTASEFQASPASLLAFVDATLKKRPALSVCTALCVRVQQDRATLAVGGHPLPLHITPEGIHEVGEHGPLLGGFANVHWRDFTLHLDAGTTLVAYTDGITEAQREGEGRFGLRRLRETLGQLDGMPPAELMDSLAAALEQFRSGTHTDDTAAIALHRVAGEIEDQGRADGYAAAGTITIAPTPA
jgi:PAS domain S-box-containing protein